MSANGGKIWKHMIGSFFHYQHPRSRIMMLQANVNCFFLDDFQDLRKIYHASSSSSQARHCVQSCILTCCYNCFIRWVLILSRTSNRIDPMSNARCTGRQHSKKHSQTQLLLNENRDQHANVPCRSDLHPS